MQPIEEYKRKVDASDRVSNRLLIPMAKNLSRAVLGFAGWLVAGTGAMIGLAVANIDKIEKYVLVSGIKSAAYIYLGAIALHAVQRYSSMFITVVTDVDIDTSKALSNSDTKFNDEASDLTLSYQARVMQRLEGAMFPPVRWVYRWKSRNVQGSNSIADQTFRRAQFEACLMTLQLLVALIALFWLVQAIK